MRPKRRMIDIATLEGFETIKATEVVPSLAVHPMPLGEGSFREFDYTVTHIPTGGLVCCWLSKHDAFKVARAITDLADWPTLSKVSKKLGRKLHLAIQAALS